MSDFFERIISEKLSTAAITDIQAELLKRFFDVITPEQRQQLQSAIEQQPRFFDLLLDNLEKKIRAINSGDMNLWDWVVADELRQLDALE